MVIRPRIAFCLVSLLFVGCTTVQITQDMYQSQENRPTQELPEDSAARTEKEPGVKTPRLTVYDPTFSVFAAGGSASGESMGSGTGFSLDLKLTGRYFGVGIEGFVTNLKETSYDYDVASSQPPPVEDDSRLGEYGDDTPVSPPVYDYPTCGNYVFEDAVKSKLYGGFGSAFVRLPIEGNGHRVIPRFGLGYGLVKESGESRHREGAHYLLGLEIRTTLVWLDGDVAIGPLPRVRLGGGFDLSDNLAVGAQYVVRSSASRYSSLSQVMAVVGLRF